MSASSFAFLLLKIMLLASDTAFSEETGLKMRVFDHGAGAVEHRILDKFVASKQLFETVLATFTSTTTLFFPLCLVRLDVITNTEYCETNIARLRSSVGLRTDLDGEELPELESSLTGVEGAAGNATDTAVALDVITPQDADEHSDMEYFIREVIPDVSIIEESDADPEITPAHVDLFSSIRDSTDWPSFREKRFLKIQVSETWTSLVVNVFESTVLSFSSSTTVFTTVVFTTTSTNSVAASAGPILGQLECGVS